MLQEQNLTRLHLAGMLIFALILIGFNSMVVVDWSRGNVFFILLWVGLYGFLSVNLGYCIMCSIVSLLRPPKYLPEAELGLLAHRPSVAIVYCVKHESGNLEATMKTSYENNYNANTTLVLLSNSTNQLNQQAELRLINNLKKYFGETSVHYSLQKPPKHRGLRAWLNLNTQYEYIMVCDADTILPPDSVNQLLAKALHPDNRQVAIFQSRLDIITPSSTVFGWLVGSGQDTCQKIYTKANGLMLTNDVFYGSGALLRAEAFGQLDIPEDVLSHDIWDTTILDNYGYKTKFCYDVITFEGFPNNYLEMVRRESRWFTGCLQSLQLLKLPNLSLSNQFHIIHPVYNYLSQLVFAIWLIMGVIDHLSYSYGGGLMYFSSELAKIVLYTVTLSIIIGHRFSSCRNFSDVILTCREIIGSSSLYLNGVIYTSWVVLFGRGLITTSNWIPTAKSHKNLTWSETILALWPTTLLGLVMIYCLIFYSQLWLLTALPFLISFAFGIPITYYTSHPMTNINDNTPSINRIRQFSFSFGGFASFASIAVLIVVGIIGLNFGDFSRVVVRAAVQLGVNCPATVRLGSSYDCTFSVPGETYFPLLGTKYSDVIPVLDFYANTEQRVNGRPLQNFSPQSSKCQQINTKGSNIEIICRGIPTTSQVGKLGKGFADINVGIIAPKGISAGVVADTTIGWFKIEEIRLEN